MTQKKFEKVHPEWCSWQELQIARERCRAAFDQTEYQATEATTISDTTQSLFAASTRSVFIIVCLLSVHLLDVPSFVCWNGIRHWYRSS